MQNTAESELREGASESETEHRTCSEEREVHDLSAITSVYGTPRAHCSFSSNDSLTSPTYEHLTVQRSKSSINLEKYELALKEQKEAIKDRNELIRKLTERLRVTAGEQNKLLKEEHEKIKNLEMELARAERKPPPELENTRSPEFTKLCDLKNSAVFDQLEATVRENSSLQKQVQSLRNQSKTATEEAESWKSKVALAEHQIRIVEERSRGIEGELSEVKTQLIWVSEEHEQTKVKLQMRESELNRVQQDLQLRNESLSEAMARLEALRKFETESTVLHRSLQQLKSELNQSQSLNKSLREQLHARAQTNIHDSISDQTQYFELPTASLSGGLSDFHKESVSELLASWPDCGVSGPVDTVHGLLEAFHSIRQYFLKGKAQLEGELHDVLKEGQEVQSLQDVVAIVQTLKAYGLQGRRVPGLEEEICSLKVKLAVCEARLDSVEKEAERLRAAECSQPYVAEMERVRMETEAEVAQKLYALQSENLQLQHKRSLLESQVANLLNSNAQGTAGESSQATDQVQDAVLHSQPVTSSPSFPRSNTSERSDELDRSSQDSLSLNLEDSREGVESLLEERTVLLQRINTKLDKDSRKLLQKLMNLNDRILSSYKLLTQNELADKIRLAQKQTEDAIEQKYLAQIESLTAKWECDKNSALHDQLLRYLHELSEPMTVNDHMVAIRALLEAELFEARMQFSFELQKCKEVTALLDEASAEALNPNQLYEQLCDSIETTRVQFQDMCGALIKAVNSAKDAIVLKDNNRLNELQTVLDEFRELVFLRDSELSKLRSELEAVHMQTGELRNEKGSLTKEVQAADSRLLEISGVVEALKTILGVQCDYSELPTLLQDMVSISESDGVSLKDLAKALRNGAKLAEEAKRILVSKLNDSQMSSDVSTFSIASSTSAAHSEQLIHLRKEYDLLQQKLAQVEEQKEFLENASFASQMDISGCELKLSNSLIKLVGELRQEKVRASELQRKLEATLSEDEAQKPKRVSFADNNQSQARILQDRQNLQVALQSNQRLLSILSDLVKTCVSCEQDIVRVLQDVGVLNVDCNHTIPLIDEEEPLPSLGSTLNVSRDEGINGPSPSNQEHNELMEDVMELPISLGSLADGSNDPQDDMLLVPSRRLKASVSQMVDYVKTSNSHWSSKIKDLEDHLDKIQEELRDEKSARADFQEQLVKAKESVIGLEEARDRLYSELQLTASRLHEAEHALHEDSCTKRKLEERLRGMEHMKFVRDRQDQIIESSEALKSAASEEESVEHAELTEENCRLEKENFSLTRSCEREISLRDERISSLESFLEEVSAEREDIETKVQALLREKNQTLEAMERQLQQSKKFFQDVSQEKDAECEALEREIRNLRETLARERKQRSASGEKQKDQLDSLECELLQKNSDMELLIKKRSELEVELRSAKERIDDLTEVVERLEQDLRSEEVIRQLKKLPEMTEIRSLSPASESTSDVLSDSLAQHDFEMNFKVLKEQLRKKDDALRHLEKQQLLLQDVSSRLRLMAERLHSVLASDSAKAVASFEIQEPGEELMSPSSSLHLSQLKAFEDNLEKLLQLVDTLKKGETQAKARISLLEREYEDHETEIADYRLKHADLLNKLEKRQVEMTQPSIFASDLQMQVISAEKKAEGLENELHIAENEVKKLKETKLYLEDRMDALVKEVQILRKKLTVYEHSIYDNDELDISSSSSSRSSSRSSPKRSLSLKSTKDNNNAPPHLCQQCNWMKEMLDKQELELRKFRIEAFERSVNEKRECASVCSSEMSSSPEGFHQSAQLQTSLRDSSLNRELQEEVLTLRSEKEMLEHRKGVYEAKCSTLQSEVNQLKNVLDELRRNLTLTIPLEDHEKRLRHTEETLLKSKMDAIGELEITWQERVEKERQMHLRIIREKDLLLSEAQETTLGHRKEKEFLSEQLQTTSKDLRDTQSILASRQQQIGKLDSEIQRLQSEVLKVRKAGESFVRETSLKIKEAMSKKIKDCQEQLRTAKTSLAESTKQLEGNKASMLLLEAILQRRIDSALLQQLHEAFPDCQPFDWLRNCESCTKLRQNLEEALLETTELRAQLKTGNLETELVSLLHKLYWVFRRSESRCMQLLVQKSYLQNCALTSIESPPKKRSLKTVCIVIMAVYRMKHRRLRWTMAAVAHPDKQTIVAKISPYIQHVPNSKNLRALQPAPQAEASSNKYPTHSSKFPVVQGISVPLRQCSRSSDRRVVTVSSTKAKNYRDEDGSQIRQRKIT